MVINFDNCFNKEDRDLAFELATRYQMIEECRACQIGLFHENVRPSRRF